MHLDPMERLRGAPFTLAMALEAGLSRARLAALLRARSVRRVLAGVYVSTDLHDSIELRVMAVKLVVRPFVVVCDRTAGWLQQVDTLTYPELEMPPPIDTCVPNDKSRIRREGCQGKRRDLEPNDVVELLGQRVTTPLRTATDLGRSLRRYSALATLDGYLRAGWFNRAALTAQLPRFAGHRGVVQLRELVSLADGRAESPGESWARLAIIDAGLPAPEPQYVVTHQGRDLFRLDLPYPKHKVVVELEASSSTTAWRTARMTRPGVGGCAIRVGS